MALKKASVTVKPKIWVRGVTYDWIEPKAGLSPFKSKKCKRCCNRYTCRFSWATKDLFDGFKFSIENRKIVRDDGFIRVIQFYGLLEIFIFAGSHNRDDDGDGLLPDILSMAADYYKYREDQKNYGPASHSIDDLSCGLFNVSINRAYDVEDGFEGGVFTKKDRRYVAKMDIRKALELFRKNELWY